MEGDRAIWEGKVGFDLSFERMDDKRACRIAAHHPAIYLSAEMEPWSRRQVVDWGVTSLVAMMIDALNIHLRERAKALRGQVQPAGSSSHDAEMADLAPDAESHWRSTTA